jgi:ferredoxin
VAEQLADVMGVELGESYPYRPVIHCSATNSDRLKQARYEGEPTCAAANVVGGVQGCSYGCLGFGDCVDSCEYDAMTLVDGLPRINYENCVGCGACVRACPRNLIEQIPFKVEQMLVVGCANRDPGKAVREVCKVGCIGCGLCARKEPEVFHMEQNLATIDYSNYTGREDFGPVVDKCPMESLVTFGKPRPEHLEEIADEPEMALAGRPDDPHTEAEDLHWRG